MTNFLLTIIAIPHFVACLLIFRELYDVVYKKTNKLFDFEGG